MEFSCRGKKSKELYEKALARAGAKAIPFTLALVEIYREDPDLYEAARGEVLCERADFVAIGSVGFNLVTRVQNKF